MNNPVVALGHRLLEYPFCYDLFQECVGSVKFRKQFTSKVLDNLSKESILDLGCGTSSIMELLEDGIEYIGIDISEHYIQKAKMRAKGKNAIFINADISDAKWTKNLNMQHKVNALALGIFHHIDDNQMLDTISNLTQTLPVGSTISSLDPIIDSQTTNLAKWFAENDRGKHIRGAEVYSELFSKNGFKLEHTIQRNAFKIPYDLLLMTATKLN